MAKARKAENESQEQGAPVPDDASPSEARALSSDIPSSGSEESDFDYGDEDADHDKEEENIPLVLEKTIIAEPLFKEFRNNRKAKEDNRKKGLPAMPETVYPIIIDVNLMYHAGREKAKQRVQAQISEILKDNNFTKNAKEGQGVNPVKTRFSEQYVFAALEEGVIKELVRRDNLQATQNGNLVSGLQAIYHIWPDFKIQKLTLKSVATVKADAARNAFSALGEDIYWAVMDSGIDGTHLHFKSLGNLILPTDPDPLQHRDFTVFSTELSTNQDISQEVNLKVDPNEKPLEDEFGHGTHVAGIIAGEMESTKEQEIVTITLLRDENKKISRTRKPLSEKSRISGMAPKCKLVSLKVLDSKGQGLTSNLIAAIQWIQEINGYGRRIRIHGVNMSVGYEFEPEWFACGQSPLCVEVDRLVKSGVVVVVAAGNTGYGFVQAQGKKTAVTAGIDLTINDPGNADLAITVGSTHREMPHIYGVSYFSSKGPTGDGRLKPDLVAPGEKIISCDSTQRRLKDPQVIAENLAEAAKKQAEAEAKTANEQPEAGAQAAKEPAEPGAKPEIKTGFYRENSGTSMAAPHVSGVIAAFLSVRREFIGKPEALKEIFLSTATDLKREKYFQGHGLVDLMRAIQSV